MEVNTKCSSEPSGCGFVPMFLRSLLIASASTVVGALFLRGVGAYASSDDWPAFDATWCVPIVFLAGLACGFGAVVALALAVHPSHRRLALIAVLGGAAAYYTMWYCEIFPLA